MRVPLGKVEKKSVLFKNLKNPTMTDIEVKREELTRIAVDSGFDPDELSRRPTWEIESLLNGLPKPIEILFDDAATVIDMPNLCSSTDEKFVRIEWLVQNETKIRHAIDTNKAAFDKYVNQWERDDLVALKKEIDYGMMCLQSICNELNQLKQLFLAECMQKLDFYKKNVNKLVDASGELDSHFNHKIKLLENQIQKMNQH